MISQTEKQFSPQELENEFLKDILKMYQTGLLSDLSIQVQDKTFQVHRNILGVRSEYFKKLFKSQMKDSTSNTLHFDHPPEYFEVVLYYFYTGQYNVTPENTMGVLKICDELQINGLKQQCYNIIKQWVSKENLFKILEVSNEELYSYCKKYFEVNAREMIKQESFLTISKQTLIDLYTSDHVKLSEIEIFQSIIHWGKYQLFKEKLDQDYTKDEEKMKQLKDILSDIIVHVRFPLMSPHELYEIVEPSKVVRKDLLLEAYKSHALNNPRVKVREGSLFVFSGVKENLPLKMLRGWTLYYHKPYSDKTTESILEGCKGIRILVGAKSKNSNTIAICAIGEKEKVLKETQNNQVTEDNEVYWYHWKNNSFGFSDTKDINLGSADLTEGTRKLSWHLTGRGGYRVGEIKNLNESEQFEKLIFYN